MPQLIPILKHKTHTTMMIVKCIDESNFKGPIHPKAGELYEVLHVYQKPNGKVLYDLFEFPVTANADWAQHCDKMLWSSYYFQPVDIDITEATEASMATCSRPNLAYKILVIIMLLHCLVNICGAQERKPRYDGTIDKVIDDLVARYEYRDTDYYPEERKVRLACAYQQYDIDFYKESLDYILLYVQKATAESGCPVFFQMPYKLIKAHEGKITIEGTYTILQFIDAVLADTDLHYKLLPGNNIVIFK